VLTKFNSLFEHLPCRHLTLETQLYPKRTKPPKWRAYKNGAKYEIQKKN